MLPPAVPVPPVALLGLAVLPPPVLDPVPDLDVAAPEADGEADADRDLVGCARCVGTLFTGALVSGVGAALLCAVEPNPSAALPLPVGAPTDAGVLTATAIPAAASTAVLSPPTSSPRPRPRAFRRRFAARRGPGCS
ncbi:hypothetical protein [Streptacidiphilus rugosus]|uniref:hypothetical protein n=1 Tax=Streptacidiphilus rugosus TaxID=405783 RepID=UPI0012FB84F3|nr:hypothetical protein [Streptacidiphilus rugosus]